MIIFGILGLGMALGCWWWRKNLRTPEPELTRPIPIGDEATPPDQCAPFISEAYELPPKRGHPGDDCPSAMPEPLLLDSLYGGVALDYPIEPSRMPVRELP
jgi:hypothetical protein